MNEEITANGPIPDAVKTILNSHAEGIVILVDNSNNESNILIFSKLIKRGLLSSYLAELLKNLLQTIDDTQ